MSARQAQDVFLDSRVTAVKAVSDARAAKLAKLGIERVRDLLMFYPHRYIDLSHVATCAAAPIGEQATVVGRVDELRHKHPRPRLDIVEAAVVDETGVLMGVWFRQPWILKRLKEGMRVALGGKVGFDYGFKRIVSPTLEVLGDATDAPRALMVPVHHATEGITTAYMRRFVANALAACADIHDILPLALRHERGLMNRKAAFLAIHFPRDKEQQRRARTRLAYEELLCLQLEMMRRRAAETRGARPFSHDAQVPEIACLRAALSFELTADQDSCVAEILADMAAPRPMTRMLLGDVGCGKTVVAAFALACAAGSGHQAAMMAPTEVLARQYAAKLGGLLDAADVSWAVLTGSTGREERAVLLAELGDGRLQVLFGTHALIEPDVAFADLSLVVIDEQHRFGVEQRAALRGKGEGSDLLVMTATPIPRTLALTLYGDLETSYIRTRPVGRAPTETRVVSRDARPIAYDAIREAVEAGRQAYIICPLVGLSRETRAEMASDGSLARSLSGGADISDAKAAEDEAAFLARSVFPDFSVGLLTGRMNSRDKRCVMDEFAAGDIAVLVATTVVEVGVDVPNATVMMVEDAERFGLAQLHQLRGRVGRGQHAGQFFLVADPGKDDAELAERLDALCRTDDGFELAELDLAARREGDVLGAAQHGAGALRLVNVVDDAALVKQAHADARALLAADPLLADPANAALATELDRRFSGLDDELNRGA